MKLLLRCCFQSIRLALANEVVANVFVGVYIVCPMCSKRDTITRQPWPFDIWLNPCDLFTSPTLPVWKSKENLTRIVSQNFISHTFFLNFILRHFACQQYILGQTLNHAECHNAISLGKCIWMSRHEITITEHKYIREEKIENTILQWGKCILHFSFVCRIFFFDVQFQALFFTSVNSKHHIMFHSYTNTYTSCNIE